MRFYTTQHPFYCGIDLHARTMYVCIMQHDGEIMLHRNMQAAPALFLKAIAPYREGLVVAVEGIFTWYWLAALWAEEGMPFVLGHALSRKASHGGTATNDTIDAHKIAALLRGGLLPQAYVQPAPLHATRDLLRRRPPLMRNRSALWAHVHNTKSHQNLPEIGKQLAYKAHRDGGAARFADPAVPKSIAVDLALSPYDAQLLSEVALSIVQAAQHHDAHTLCLWQPVPGLGKLLSLVLLYDMHDMDRVPPVQAVVSQGRLGTCAKESAGKRLGTSGKTIGTAPLQGAFSEAAALFLRHKPAGQKQLARLETKHAKGKAVTILAHQLARAVYSMLKHTTAFHMAKVLHSEGSRVGEPDASLDPQGISLDRACPTSSVTASLHAKVRIGLVSQSLGLGLDIPSGSCASGASRTQGRGLPLARA